MTTTKQIILALPFAVWGLIACTNSSRENNTANQQTTVDTSTTIMVAHNDTIIYDDSSFPTDSSFSAKVLTVGAFHGDEIFKNASQLKWFGLFHGLDGYYLKQTKIKTISVNDPIVDENENEKTGCEVQVLNKDTCIILIEPLPFFADRSIKGVKLTKNYIYPGDTISLNYLGVNYKIFATGGKKKVQSQNGFDVWNYKLYVTATIKGKPYKSLLVAQPDFDEQMIRLIFAGDIDGDGILDLIIDTSRHYNATRATVYLSRPANDGEVVKPIGVHTSVGC